MTISEEYMEKRIFGYARVSTQEQNLDRQILALEKYVKKENILVDKASGKNFERPSYQALKGALGLREGDELYVTSLDRLSRNKQQIKSELEYFKTKKIRLKILDLPTSMVDVPAGQEWIIEMVNQILIEVLASLAEQERIMIHKRQQEGIAAAHKRGVHMGRPKAVMPDNFHQIYEEWKAGKITAKKAMRVLNLSSSTFYRMVHVYEENRK